MAIKKILLVSKWYAPATGGIEFMVKQYAETYQAAGYEVTVLCVHETRCFKTTTEDRHGIRVIRLASLGNFLSMPMSLSFLGRFYGVAKQHDAIHVNIPFPLASFVLAFCQKFITAPVVVSYQCDLYRQRFLKKISYFFDRIILKRAHRVITLSPPVREHSEVLSCLTRPIEIIPPFLDEAYIQECLNAPHEVTLPAHFKEQGYFVFFGRLASYKGIPILISALRRLLTQGMAINILVFGEGPLASMIQALSDEYPERIYFIPHFLADPDKYQLLQQARALLFPSQYISESFGITQLEAMAVGCPVINCQLNTGVNWVAPEGVVALTCATGSDEAYAALMAELWQHSDQYDDLREQAKTRFLTYFEKKRVAKLLVDGMLESV